MGILVTSDGSERSAMALRHAAALAHASDSDLALVRVMDKRLDLGSVLAPTVRAAARTVAERWIAELEAQARAAGVHCEPRVAVKDRREDTSAAILRVAREGTANAVAMATRGDGALRHALLGSVAMSVVGHAGVPVMLVGQHAVDPPAEPPRPYHVLVTTDGSPASEDVWPGFRRLFREAGPREVRLTVLRVHAPSTAGSRAALGPLDAEWHLAQFRRLAPGRFEAATLVREIEPLGGVDTAILAAAEELGASTIWMASHGHSAGRHLLAGSVALGVLSRATIPVTLVGAGR